MVPTPTCRFDSFTREELADLADRLGEDDPIAIEWCVTFVEAETHGLGHGRARARMARRLKHCRVSKHQKSRLIRAILNRLVNGTFSEQFKDQLRLAIHLEPTQAGAAARICQGAATEYVRRYAAWVLSREAMVEAFTTQRHSEYL